MNKMRSVYLISGPLGVGKTTVTRKLITVLEDAVLIDGDHHFHATEKLPALTWEKRIEVTWKNILLITRNYLEYDLNVVIDFVVEDELKWFLTSLSDMKADIFYIVLIANEAVLKERLTRRNEIQYLDRSLTILKKITSGSDHSKYLLDTSGLKIDDVIKEILTDERFKTTADS